jgi:DNA-directed RNA polymerase specialized sigma24 family protein
MYLYSAHSSLKVDDAGWNKFAFIREEDMLMLGDSARYVLAEMLNKFHFMYTEQGLEGVELSCNDIINFLSLKLSTETIRLYFNMLEEQGHISFIRRQQGARYEVKFTDRLRNYELSEVIRKSAAELATAFSAYKRAYFGDLTSNKNLVHTFMEFLEDGGGVAYKERKKQVFKILAYLSKDEGRRLTIRTPLHLIKRYDELMELSAPLSKRFSKRYIRRLISGKIKSVYVDDVPSRGGELFKVIKPEEDVMKKKVILKESGELSNEESRKIWDGVEEWEKEKGPLLKWIWNTRYRLTRTSDVIDLDDYMSQARLLMFSYISGGGSREGRNSWLEWKLKDYIFKAKSKGRVYVEDFDAFLEHIEISNDEEEEVYELSPEIKKALDCLPVKTRKLIKDRFGFGGCKYTFEELGKKYKCSSKGQAYRIYYNGIAQMKTILDPPT